MTKRHFDLMLDAWADLGPDAAPPRLRQAVSVEIRSTRQAGWLARRFPIVSHRGVRYGLAAIALAAAALLGVRLLPPNVGPQPTATATPSPDLSAYRALTETPEACQTRADEPQGLPAGDYLIDEPFPLRIGLTIPGGWVSWVCRSNVVDLTAPGELPQGSGWGLTFMILGENAEVYEDPCAHELMDPPVGPSVDEFMAALAGLSGYQVTGPIETELDSHRGLQVDLVAPEYSYVDCASGPTGPGAGSISGHLLFIDRSAFRMRPGEQVQFRLFDIEGTRLLVVVDDYPGTDAVEEEAGLPHSDDAHADDLVQLHRSLDALRIL